MRATTKRGRGHGQRASGGAGLAARQFAGSRRPRLRSRLGRDAARSIAAIAEGSVRSGSGEKSVAGTATKADFREMRLVRSRAGGGVARRTWVPPRPKPPWNLESTMPRPRAMSCWSSEMSSSMPFQRDICTFMPLPLPSWAGVAPSWWRATRPTPPTCLGEGMRAVRSASARDLRSRVLSAVERRDRSAGFSAFDTGKKRIVMNRAGRPPRSLARSRIERAPWRRRR